MGSSPTPQPVVDIEPSTSASGRPDADPPKLRHSAAVLLIDVVRLLHRRGLPVIEAHAYSSDALRAVAELLRCIGIEADPAATRPPTAHGPVLGAAARLLRAAGIEPNTVPAWPDTPDEPGPEGPLTERPAESAGGER